MCRRLQKATGLATKSRSARSVSTIQNLRTRMNKYSHEPAVRALDEQLPALTA
ncbi:MAG TPA: hypothetical protein VGD15_16875 [Kribbella sp.]